MLKTLSTLATIVDAIAPGDQVTAEEVMYDHFVSMIGETERYRVGGTPSS